MRSPLLMATSFAVAVLAPFTAIAGGVATCGTFSASSAPVDAVNDLYTVQLETGNRITVTADANVAMEFSPASGPSALCGFGGSPACNGFIFRQDTVAVATNVQIEVVSTNGLTGNYSFATTCTNTPALSSGATATPTNITTLTQLQTNSGQATTVSAGGQATAFGSTFRSALNLRGTGGGFSPSGSGVATFLPVTPDGRTGIWGGVSYRSFDGTFDGSSRDFIAGVDHLVTPDLSVGLAVALGDLDVEAGGIDYDVDAVSYGPYIAGNLTSNIQLDAYLLLGDPDYEVGGTSFEADRWLGEVSLSTDYAVSWGVLSPRVGFRAYEESLPAYTVGGTALAARDITQRTGSLSVRSVFDGIKGITPYVQIGADYNRFDDGLGANDTYTSPRYGLGFTMPMGAATLSVDVDGGEIADGTDDLGVSAVIRGRF